MKSSRIGWLTCLAVAAMIASLVTLLPQRGAGTPFVAYAQSLTPRTVSGAVLDAGDKPLVGATVFLKNLKTKSIRSFSTVDKGHYYFAQVSRIEDYELWAEKGDKKSAVKTVSSWDTRAKFVTDLKIK